MKNRGQVETIGLVVIVILIIFIGIFALSFSLKPKEVNDDILTLKANALRSSLLKTSVCDTTVKQVLGNYIDGNFECFSDVNELKNNIKQIIEGSLENENYYFKFKDIELGSCQDKITAVSEVVNSENVEIAVCRR